MALQPGSTCIHGHEIKSWEELSPTAYTKSGILYKCKHCQRERQRAKRRGQSLSRPPRLRPGVWCRKNKHYIAEESDLFYGKHKDTGNDFATCRKCKNEAKQAWRSRKKDPDYKPRAGSMLDRGECKYGHKLEGPEDTYRWTGKNGPGTRVACKLCHLAGNGHLVTRFVIFDCTHEVIFEPPLPQKDDIVFCRKCDNFRVVSSHGKPFRKDPVVNAEEVHVQ